MNVVPIELFAEAPTDECLHEMSFEATYGEKITLRAIANFFSVKVVAISTLGGCGGANILPQHSVPLEIILLDRFAEGHGKHYVSLEQVEQIDDVYDHDEAYQQASST